MASCSSLISGLPVSHLYMNSSSTTRISTDSSVNQEFFGDSIIDALNKLHKPVSDARFLLGELPDTHENAALLTPEATEALSSTASDDSRSSKNYPAPASPPSTTSAMKTPPPRSAQSTVRSSPRNPVQTASAGADVPNTNPSVSEEPHAKLSAFKGPYVQPGPSGTTGQQIRTGPSGAVVINGVSIAPGQLSGSTILVESGHLIINSKTLDIAYPPNAASAMIFASALTIDGVTLRPNSGSTVILGDLNIGPGQHTTIQGTSMSFGVDSVVVGSSTNDMPTATSTGDESAPSALAALAGPTSVLMLGNGAIVIGHATLPSGSPISIGGTPVSVGSPIIVIGSSTYVAPKMATLLPASNGAIVFGHDTLSHGEITSLSGKIVSVGSSNVEVTATPFLDMPMPSVASNGAIVLGQATLSYSGVTILSGQVVSAGSSRIIVDGTTFPLRMGTSAPGSEPRSSAVLGPIVASMLGYTPLPRPSAASIANVEASPTPTSVLSTSVLKTAAPISNLTVFTGAQSRVTAGKSILIRTLILWVLVGSFALAL